MTGRLNWVDRNETMRRWKSSLDYLKRTSPPVDDADMKLAHDILDGKVLAGCTVWFDEADLILPSSITT